MHVEIKDWLFGDKVNLGDGLRVPETLDFSWVQDGASDDIGGNVKVEARLESGRYRVTRLTIEGPAVTTALLGIPIAGSPPRSRPRRGGADDGD